MSNLAISLEDVAALLAISAMEAFLADALEKIDKLASGPPKQPVVALSDQPPCEAGPGESE